jgi:hypothetical protein
VAENNGRGSRPTSTGPSLCDLLENQTMRCPSCQAEVSDDHEYCWKCLSDLHGAPPARKSDAVSPAGSSESALNDPYLEQVIQQSEAPAPVMPEGDPYAIFRFFERTGIQIFGVLCGATGALCSYAVGRFSQEPWLAVLPLPAAAGTLAFARFCIRHSLRAHEDDTWMPAQWIMAGIFGFIFGAAAVAFRS